MISELCDLHTSGPRQPLTDKIRHSTRCMAPHSGRRTYRVGYPAAGSPSNSLASMPNQWAVPTDGNHTGKAHRHPTLLWPKSLPSGTRRAHRISPVTMATTPSTRCQRCSKQRLAMPTAMTATPRVCAQIPPAPIHAASGIYGRLWGILPSLQLTYDTRLMAICPERDTAR